MKKLLRVVGWFLSSLGGLIVTCYLVVLVVNLRDQPPSEAALRLARIVDDRPVVADADNAAILAFGFNVTANEDPQRAGVARRDWIVAVGREPDLFYQPPDFVEEIFDAETAPAAHAIRDACGEKAGVGCRDLFDQLATGTFTDTEQRYLARYEQLLQRRAWLEPIPQDLRLPLPAFSQILQAQRLRMIDLRRRARPGSASAIRAALHVEHEFWREVQKSADVLITKMIAVVGIRQNLFYGNLVVRALPPSEQLAALPDGWSRELSTEELSMHRVMAGELRWFESVTREVLTMNAWRRMPEWKNKQPKWSHHVVLALGRPLFRPQDDVNHHAAQHLALADRFRVPLPEYFAAVAVTKESEAHQQDKSWRLYNPVSQFMRRNSGAWIYADYPLRVAALEGLRRAALLTTRLRVRAVEPSRVPDELDAADLREPFGSQPFHWSETEPAVVYNSPDKATVTRHVYFY